MRYPATLHLIATAPTATGHSKGDVVEAVTVQNESEAYAACRNARGCGFRVHLAETGERVGVDANGDVVAWPAR